MLYAKKTIGTVGYMGGLMALPEAFCWSWGQMIQYNNEYLCGAGERVHYVKATFSYHAAARNNLVDQIIGDWLLMLDTDHVFDPDIVSRLACQMDKEVLYSDGRTEKPSVISGLYLHKSSPHPPVIYQKLPDKDILVPLGDWEDEHEDRIIDIGSAGAGCLMVRREVFDRIKSELNEGAFDIIPPYGEDHSFFKRLHRLGIQAYCNPRIECHHLIMKPLTLADYRKDEVNLERIDR